MKTASKIVIGLDPGTGSSSPMGLAVFEPASRKVLLLEEFWTKHTKLEHRIKDISDRIEAILQKLQADNPKTKFFVFIESFVMRGKGGETLQRMIGSAMGRVPYEFKLAHVGNKTVKLLVAGHGAADKAAVAEETLKYFRNDPQVYEQIRLEKWDKLDALAIGLAGWLLEGVSNG